MGAQVQVAAGHDGMVGKGGACRLIRRRDENCDSACHDGRSIGRIDIELEVLLVELERVVGVGNVGNPEGFKSYQIRFETGKSDVTRGLVARDGKSADLVMIGAMAADSQIQSFSRRN